MKYFNYALAGNLYIKYKQSGIRIEFVYFLCYCHFYYLQVTSLLLEAERRKLSVLQRELQVALEEGGSIKAKEHQKQELLIAIA